MKKRLSADAWSAILSACAIGLFAAGHVLPFWTPLGGVQGESGWRIWIGVVQLFYVFREYHWFSVFQLLFLPATLLGIVSFFGLARSYPRGAGWVALLSGLCAVPSLVTVGRVVYSYTKLPPGSGYYVWFASMILLSAAGVCKLIHIRKQPATTAEPHEESNPGYSIRMRWLLPLALASAISFLFMIPWTKITRGNLERIQVGMTLEEVENILGGPARGERSRRDGLQVIVERMWDSDGVLRVITFICDERDETPKERVSGLSIRRVGQD
jgi:hypothetical protein